MCKKQTKLSGLKQPSFNYGQRFCGAGIWMGHSGGVLSLLRNAWNLRWEDSKVGDDLMAKHQLIWRPLHSMSPWWLKERPKLATSAPKTWPLLWSMVASGWSNSSSGSGSKHKHFGKWAAHITCYDLPQMSHSVNPTYPTDSVSNYWHYWGRHKPPDSRGRDSTSR